MKKKTHKHFDFWIYAPGTPLPSGFPYQKQLWISKFENNQFFFKLSDNTIRKISRFPDIQIWNSPISQKTHLLIR